MEVLNLSDKELSKKKAIFFVTNFGKETVIEVRLILCLKQRL